jgi:hypothetical protein
LPAYVVPDSGDAASWAAAAGDVERPADSSEALAWREPAQAVTPAELFTELTTAGVVRQLVRVDLPLRRLAVVERVATYLRAVPTDREGVALGPVFTTTGAGDYDPFQVLIHPTDQSMLVVRWSLLGLNTNDPEYSGVPGYMLPHEPIQIAAHWSDLRWGWGQRYTTGLQLEVPAGKTSVRLFATIATSSTGRLPGAWRVSVGGRLAVWTISGGPRRAALTAAVKRTG